MLAHFYFCVPTQIPTQRTMACCPLYAVQTSSVKIIETCGAFKTIARPGLNCLIPFVDNIATTVSMRLQQMEIACETKSRDNVRVAEKEMACECAAADADADRASPPQLCPRRCS